MLLKVLPHTLHPQRSPSSPFNFHQFPVCIIGNAPSPGAARLFDAQFPDLPSAWSIWGGSSAAVERTPFPHILVPSPNSTWAQGVLGAYQALMSLGPLQPGRRAGATQDVSGGRTSICQYFFLADDDARYAFTPGASSHAAADASIAGELLDALKTFQPAVMAFPWNISLNRTAGIRSVRDAYAPAAVGGATSSPGRVYPLTGFDNGNVLFHHSLMPFILPFAPHHEEGLHGEWTLPATWLQFFLPRMYQSHALVLATVQYANGLSLDSHAAKPVLRKMDRDTGLATYEGSRHPYEWPLKRSYEAYLSWGLKQAAQPFGAATAIEQVEWMPPQRQVSVQHLSMSGLQSLPFDAFLPRLNAFFDVLHPAVLNRPYVRAHHTREELVAVRRASPITMRVFVFTMDRVQSLQRLMQSLASARFDLVTHPIVWDLHIIVDTPATSAGPQSRTGHKAVLDYVRTLAWPHGDLTVRTTATNFGLKASIMGAWEPVAGADEMALFLEDDISLSPLFPVWTERAVRTYYYGQDRPMGSDELFGVALYAPRWSQVDNQPWSPDDTDGNPVHEPYLSQLPCSWGGVYFSGPWRRFLDWYRLPGGGDGGRADPLVPNLIGINSWPHQKSWKKYLVRFMAETGGYMLYPDMPGGMSFSTNHMEAGTNEKRTGSSALADLYQVPLASDEDYASMFTKGALAMPPLDKLRVYDVFGALVPGLVQATIKAQVDLKPAITWPAKWRLPLMPASSWAAYRKFTIVIPSHRPRWAKLERFLAHYSRSPSVAAIVVVWNDADGELPTHLEKSGLKDKASPVPLSLLAMQKYDINNRFLPHPEITTDAVLSLDDDVIIDLKDIEFAFYVWQMHPMNLVGFRWTTRGYARCSSIVGYDKGDEGLIGAGHRFERVAPPAQDCNGGVYQYVRRIPTDIVAHNLRDFHFSLTGATFMHRLYLSMYSGVTAGHALTDKLGDVSPGVMDAVREWVLEENNCEDIAMNFMVSAATKQQPAIIVEGKFDTKSMADGDGLWKRPNHYQKRSSCIHKMESLIGKGGLPVSVTGFPQPWQDEWREQARVPPKREF